MANEKNDIQREIKPRKKKRKKKKLKIFRVFLLVILLLLIIAIGAGAGMLLGIIKSAPDIDPANALGQLTESSTIVDQNGNIIEKIHSPNENREIVSIDIMPKYLQDAFIAIEDQRFEDHFGLDIRRIGGAVINNVLTGNPTGQGASTITQQLVKNLYLTNEKSFERKIKEAYLSIQMERKLTKRQILENYLNTIPLGQTAGGVQAASYAYFSKDVSELTLAESALLAAIPKSTKLYSPYKRVEMSDLDGIPEEDIVGYVYVGSIQYACVFNENAVERQHIVLDKMKELGKITQDEYDQAMAEDMRAALNPGQKKIEGISSNFTDYVKDQVIEDLMNEFKLDYEDAENYLYKGGLTIYTTMDVDMQKTLEKTYENFGEILLGKTPPQSVPLAQDWTNFRWSGGVALGMLDSYKNILNESGNVLYYKHSNYMDENNNLFLYPGEFKFNENGDLVITSDKFNLYASTIDVVDCYTINDNNNLVSHNVGGLNIGENYEIIDKQGAKGTFTIPADYVTKNQQFFTVKDDGLLYIDNSIYYYQENGIVQPQSGAIIMDYRTGQIKAMLGGREITGSKTFNRAVDSARQPGSTIKPLSVYLPALDLGYTAASIIDDVPKYDSTGKRWPKNWYEYREFKYHGLCTMRYSIEDSINTNAVTMLENIGLNTAINYLTKLGIIDAEDPENDTFVSQDENSSYNDVNAAALALGGLTKGFTPLDMTNAYGVIANNGVYVEAICYTKITDTDGNMVLEKIPETHTVVSPEVAYIMKDLLLSSVNRGLAGEAKMANFDVAGKTGTTNDNGDLWFLGFSDYYVGGVWVGNDNSSMKLSVGSAGAARLWNAFMTPIHANLAPARFSPVDGIISLNVCKDSGKLATGLCSQDQRGSRVYTEKFVKGTEPKEYCTTHVQVEVCADSNMLPSQYCPGDKKVTRVFINREIPYNPDANPYGSTGNILSLSEANKLYLQVRNDMANGFKIEELEQIYAGSVTFADGKIATVNGFTPEQLEYSKLYTEDYRYQVPTQVCYYHNQWHWYQWINQNGDGNGEKNPDDGNETTNTETPSTNPTEPPAETQPPQPEEPNNGDTTTETPDTNEDGNSDDIIIN